MKQNTQQLISSLAQDTLSAKQLPTPQYIALRLCSILFVYAIVIGFTLGLRSDLSLQFHRPFFLTEIFLLLSLVFSSIFSAVLLLFPDLYQKKYALYWPLYILGAFVLLLVLQSFLPLDARMVVPIGKVHAMECTICIASIAMIPSALIFVLLRKGASVHPFLSGSYTMIASSSIGCLMLRLAEANDSILHLTLWHYIPTLIFASLGALIGKIFFKW